MLQPIIQNGFQTDPNKLVSLPLSISINDIRNVVGFLKNKSEGISLVEINDIFHRRLLDTIKLASYETWGIIRRENNIIKLSKLGEQLAGHLENEAGLYRQILRSFLPYHKSLEWIWGLNTEIITYNEIIQFWKENDLAKVPVNNEKFCENSVVSFFNLCHAAELGISAVGRKGQPTRLSVNQMELKKYFNNIDDNSSEKLFSKIREEKETDNTSINRKRLLISCEDETNIFPSLRDLLEISGIDYKVTIRSKDEILPSDKTHELMRNCSSAIIIANENSRTLCSGNYRFNDRLLSEIVAAYALFDTKVLLLWQGSSLPNPVFSKLNIICLKTNKLDWEKGIKIGRIIREFWLSADKKRES